MASSRSWQDNNGRHSTEQGRYKRMKEGRKEEKEWEKSQTAVQNYTRRKKYEEKGRWEKGHDQGEYRRDQAEQADDYEIAKKDYDKCLEEGVHDDDWCRSHWGEGRNLSRKLYEATIGTPNEHKNAEKLDKCLEEADKQELLIKNGTAEDVSLARDADRKECYDTFPVSTLQNVKHYGLSGYDVAKRCVKGVCSWVSTKKGGRTKRKRRRVKRKTKGRRVKRKTKGRRVKRKTKRRRVKRKTKRRKKRKRTKKR